MMKINHLALGLIVAVGGALTGFTMRSEGAPGRELRIATLDLQKTVGEYLKHTGDLEKLDQQHQTDQIAVATIRDSIDAMEQEITVYKPGSKEFQDLQKKIAIARAQYKIDGNAMEAFHSQRQAKLFSDVYQKIDAVVTAYCAEKGIDLVLLKTDAKDVKGTTKGEVTNAMVVRTVVHSADSLDITPAIIQELEK